MPTYKIFSCCNEEAISECASIVKNGGVIVFPTDTIYGIGCSPFDDSAVERIFRIKGRDERKPLPILAYSLEDAKKIVVLGDKGTILAQKFWPGALTIVASLIDQSISRKVMGGNNYELLAVRVPADSCILSLLSRCKYLVGTSANLSGKASMKSSQQVIASTLDGFDALLDGGTVERGVESTIVDVTGIEPLVLREGALKSSEVLKLIA